MHTQAQPSGEDAQAPHSNSIVDLQGFKDAAGARTGRFSTAGWDGRVLTWNVSQQHVEEGIKAVHAASIAP